MDDTAFNDLMDELDNIDKIEEGYSSYNILMLGTSGVGKTVFMTSMLYNLLMKERGLNLSVKRDLFEEISDNYESLRNRKELTPTARKTNWKFSVKYNDSQLFNFSWLDYRGGTLSDPKANPEEFKDIFQHLDNSIAVFIMVDSNDYILNQEKVKNELKRFKSIIEYSLNYNERGLHLVLLLTKCDAFALNHGWLLKKWDKNELYRACNFVFEDIFRAFSRANPAIICDVLPISSYGKSVILDKSGHSVLDNNIGFLRSFQTEIPLLKVFDTILTDIKSEIPKLKIEAEKAYINTAKMLELKNRKLFFSSIDPRRFFIKDAKTIYNDHIIERNKYKNINASFAVKLNNAKKIEKAAVKIIASAKNYIGLQY